MAACSSRPPASPAVGSASPSPTSQAIALDAAPPLPDAWVAPPIARLEVGNTVKLGDLAIEFVSNNHKHRVGGGAMGMWTFVVSKGGVAAPEFELRSEDHGFDAEVVAHGTLLGFHHEDYGTFMVELVSPTAPAAVDPEACAALVEEEAKRQGRPVDAQQRSYHDNGSGIVVMKTPAWRAFCGRYTKRVRFAK